MTVVRDQMPFLTRRWTSRALEKHLAFLTRRDGVDGPDVAYELALHPVRSFAFGNPPASVADLHRLRSKTWAVPIKGAKGVGVAEIREHWRARGIGTTFSSMLARKAIELIGQQHSECDGATIRFLQMPNLHVQALWLKKADSDSFHVIYRFPTSQPIPEFMGASRFLAFVRELSEKKQEAYARSRAWAIKQGYDPDMLCG
ncbi:hypothetical protein G6L37_06625 [Agrobacterium rubi]|nr:hypothetical protein [Agrobacterium rubi]NTF25038.1 hypothetical protein [Agrobacterium rubi]